MEYHKPNSVIEAASALQASCGMILAGGTDLCVYMAEGLYRPSALIDISGIDTLRGIEEIPADEDEETTRIGACTSISDIVRAPKLPMGLRQGAHAIGSPQIRNLATIGGNVCNASPCGDTLAPLLTLEAQFVLRSAEGTRTVPSEGFFTGPKQTACEPHEILEYIVLPPERAARVSAFRMIGKRRGQTISQVNAAVCLSTVSGVVSYVRVAVGSVAPVPLRLRELERLLMGKSLREIRLNDIAQPIEEGIRPINDVRSSATYRRRVAVALVLDALMDCASQTSLEREGACAC